MKEIIQHIETIESELELIREKLKPEGVSNYEGVRSEDGSIVLNWQGTPESELDVQFQIDGEGKWHSVRWMIEDDKDADDFDYNPPYLDGTMNVYSFDIPRDKSVKVELLEGVFDKQKNEFVADKTHGTLSFDAIEVPKAPETPKEPEKPQETEQPQPVTDFWHGLWDSWNYDGDEFNTIKTKDISDAIGVDGNVFVSFSHRWKGKTRQQWESILRGFVSTVERLDPKRTILLLQDEPLSPHHGFSLDDCQFLYDTAKKLMSDYQFGFTYTRNTVNKREIPKSDWIMLATYPFFREDYPDIQIHGKAQFDKWFDSHIKKAIGKFRGDIFVIGQGFYNPDTAEDRKRKWRKPPINAPLWYAEAVQRNKLKGIMWWVHSIDRNDTIGLSDMPEFFKAVQSIS